MHSKYNEEVIQFMEHARFIFTLFAGLGVTILYQSINQSFNGTCPQDWGLSLQ